MKKLGLVGGMGPESTLMYYHDIVYGVQYALGRQEFPIISVESVDVFTVLRLCGEKKFAELEEYLVAAIDNLVKSGAEAVALTANTAHIVYDEVQARVDVPIVSIIEATAREAKNRGYKKVGLLGTKFTMEGNFFQKVFLSKGIEIVTPTQNDMFYVNDKIASELEMGVVKQETLCAFQSIITKMARENVIEAVILGCTELPILLNDEVSPVPCLDTVRIHVDELVKVIIS